MKLLLATSSSARIHLFKNLGLWFETQSPDFDERSLHFQGDPIHYCTELAKQKSLSLKNLPPDFLAITCDTIVFFENQVFNKPTSYEDAKKMLEAFSGKKHAVYSGVCIRKNDSLLVGHEITFVEFNPLSSSQIELFLKDPRFMHRAGAYTITEKGSLLVKKIEGSYENVVGLPIQTLEILLNQWGHTLWV